MSDSFSRNVSGAPVTAQECKALREAVNREIAANMRWYRDLCRPLSLGQRAFFILSENNSGRKD